MERGTSQRGLHKYGATAPDVFFFFFLFLITKTKSTRLNIELTSECYEVMPLQSLHIESLRGGLQQLLLSRG